MQFAGKREFRGEVYRDENSFSLRESDYAKAVLILNDRHRLDPYRSVA